MCQDTVPLLCGLEVEEHEHLVLESRVSAGQGFLSFDQFGQRFMEQLGLFADRQILLPLPFKAAGRQDYEFLRSDRSAIAVSISVFNAAGIPASANSTKSLKDVVELILPFPTASLPVEAGSVTYSIFKTRCIAVLIKMRISSLGEFGS